MTKRAPLLLLIVLLMAMPMSAKVKLTTVTHWNLSTGPGALLAQYIEEYNALQDEVEIEVYNDANAGQVDHILVWAVSDTMPDILPVSQVHMADLMQAGLMVPLPDDVAEQVAQIYVPGAAEMVRYNGKLYGYPSEYIPTIFTYDIVAFEQRGLPLEFPDTWSGVVEAARKLTTYSDTGEIEKAGIGWDNNTRSNVGLLLSYTWTSGQPGAEIFSEDFRTINLVTPAAESALQFVHELFHEERVATVGGSRALADQAIRWSQSHHRCSIVTIPGRIDEIWSARVPKGADGTRLASVYGWAYIVPSTAKHQKEAHDFLIWLTSDTFDDGTTRLGRMMAELGSIPVTVADVQNQADFREEMFFRGYLETVAHNETRPWPTPVANQDVLSVLNGAVRAMIHHEATPI